MRRGRPRHRLAVVACAIAAGCTDGAGLEPATAIEPAATVVPHHEIALLHGSCAGARPLGVLANFHHVIELSGVTANVRADPSWPGDDHRNVLGQLDAPQRIAAFGPVKGIPSQGIGWVVPLRDDNGATCRGYVSATVAEAIACTPQDGELVAFPEPLDVVPGPCVAR